MKLIHNYFNDKLSQNEWNMMLKEYVANLTNIRAEFDDDTFIVLKNHELHDCRIVSFKMRIGNQDDVKTSYVLELENYEQTYRYECIYEGVRFLTFNLKYDDEFEDVLIDECMKSHDMIQHKICFVGKKIFHVKCNEIKIKKISWSYK